MEHRNHCFDTLKGLACIAVVLIHYNLGGSPGDVMKALGRFAVPLFFFISGYYLAGSQMKIERASTKRKFKHILVMYGKCILFYMVFCIVWNFLMNPAWDISGFIQKEFSFPYIVKFLVTNDPFIYSHLWYIQALLYCYMLMYVINDSLPNRAYLVMAAVLMLGFSSFAEFNQFLHLRNSYQIGDYDAYLMVFSLFIFRAMPFFALGIYIRRSRLAESKKIPLPVLIGLMAAGGIIAVLEDYYIKLSLMYLGTYLAVTAMILAGIWYPHCSIAPLEYIGNRLSMYVYIYHIAVGKTFDLILAKTHTSMGAFRPFVVLAASLCAAWLFVKIKEFLQMRSIETRQLER